MITQSMAITDFLKELEKIKILNQKKQLSSSSSNIFSTISTFLKKPHVNPAVLIKFFEDLNLNTTMSIQDLVTAIGFIEHLPIQQIDKKEFISFQELLESRLYYTLRDFQVKSTLDTEFIANLPVINEDSAWFSLSLKAHKILLDYYGRANSHAHGEIPVSQINYNVAQLNQTQAFRDLETTSSDPELPDKSTIAQDVRRKHITFNGLFLEPGSQESNASILQSIELFAGDKIDDEHSKANKINNFGGQFLDAILLNEFTNSMVLTADNQIRLERGIVKGHVDWTKDEKTNEISATVSSKILSCTYADPSDLNAPQIFLAMGSDGHSLVKLNEDELIKVAMRNKQELVGSTQFNVVPICELTAKISLIPQKNKQGYLLKVSEFSNNINTPDLISSKAPELDNASTLKPSF